MSPDGVTMPDSISAARMMEMLGEAVAEIRRRTELTPRVGIILGTGLGGLGEEIEVETEIPYGDLPHFPLSTVEGHSGRLLLGMLAGTPVVAMQGRFHRYEGYTLKQATFPVRVMKLLGAEVLTVSAAAGGMQPLWSPGELVLLDDHINLLGDNPLTGPNLGDLGLRFPDMSEPYDRGLQEMALSVALEKGIVLHRGVYVAVAGPNLETRAEYRMLRTMGADIVGMSTVPEVIVARHMDMRVLGISTITDSCLPDALEKAKVEDIIATATGAEPNLTAIIKEVVGRL